MKGDNIMQIPVGNTNINVSYTDDFAHITNDSALSKALSTQGARAVATAVKNYYSRVYRKSLNVGTTSMAIEIVGHTNPSLVSKVVGASPNVGNIVKVCCAYIVSKTDVIDTGGSSVDSNRWFWDVLANYNEFAVLV